MNTAGQFPQLGQRLGGLLAGRVDQRRQLGVRPGRPMACPSQHQAQGDQALLRTVVQVPLEPAPLGIAGLDDPRPGRADLVQLSCRRLEPGLLQSQAGPGHCAVRCRGG